MKGCMDGRTPAMKGIKRARRHREKKSFLSSNLFLCSILSVPLNDNGLESNSFSKGDHMQYELKAKKPKREERKSQQTKRRQKEECSLSFSLLRLFTHTLTSRTWKGKEPQYAKKASVDERGRRKKGHLRTEKRNTCSINCGQGKKRRRAAVWREQCWSKEIFLSEKQINHILFTACKKKLPWQNELQQKLAGCVSPAYISCWRKQTEEGEIYDAAKSGTRRRRIMDPVGPPR